LGERRLVSIGKASLVLGVSETTLRQWTDEGKIKAFVTPGGHRRYARLELRKILSTQKTQSGIGDLVSEMESTTHRHGEIARRFLTQTAWYHTLSVESQQRLAGFGRQLLHLVIRYITQRSRREEIIHQARSIGQGHGEILAGLGLPLTDSVEAFLLHREPLLEAITHLVKRGETVNRRVAEAIPLVAQIMDEALVSLVAAHQRSCPATRDHARGGGP
jgi:excisionase family DNA binding protein